MIWLLAIGQIMKNLANGFCYLAYAGGFATGNFVGLYLENKLAMGIEVVRVIVNRDASELVKHLRTQGYGVTSVDGHGASGKVNLVFMVIKRTENRPDAAPDTLGTWGDQVGMAYIFADAAEATSELSSSSSSSLSTPRSLAVPS